MKLLSVDIETTGLDFNRDKITCVGLYAPGIEEVHRDLGELSRRLTALIDAGHGVIGHNFKFDIKFLWRSGVELPLKAWVGDSHLLAAANPHKISEEWLEGYERMRVEKNKELPRGYSHRRASHHSLKTLAPYHLGISPFWEDPTEHDNDEYVIKDVRYTYDLYLHMMERFDKNTRDFYLTKLLPWTKTLTRAEYRGVKLDLGLLEEKKHTAMRDAEAAYEDINMAWSEHFNAYVQDKKDDLLDHYTERAQAAVDRLKDKSKEPSTRTRYTKLYKAALEKLEPFNMDSPSQLMWLLRDRLGLDVTRLDNGEESTDRSVLEKLAAEGEGGVKALLQYRKARKLSTSFFPSYEEMHHNGTLHTTFKPAGTRTGRLSSSKPNLQQVPSDLHSLFTARDGYQLLTYDESAIEARLIAYYSGDSVLTSICMDNHSIHDYNTRNIFFDHIKCDLDDVKRLHPHERKASKTVGFALFYGAGAKRLHYASKSLGLGWTLRDCYKKLDRFKMEYEGVFDFKESLDAMFSTGKVIRNAFGRPIKIEPRHIYMTAFNTLIQSSASDLVQHAAYRAQERWDAEGLEAHILLLVHDEIVAEVEERDIDAARKILVEEMTRNYFSPIQLEVEGQVAKCWTK